MGATFVLIPSLVPFSPWDTSREQRGDKEPFFPRAGHNPNGVRGTGVGLVGPIPNLSQPPGPSAGAAKTPSSPKCTHGGGSWGISAAKGSPQVMCGDLGGRGEDDATDYSSIPA